MKGAKSNVSGNGSVKTATAMREREDVASTSTSRTAEFDEFIDGEFTDSFEDTLRNQSNQVNIPEKKKKLWTSAEDLELLREIAVTKPFNGKYIEIPQKWAKVVDNLPEWTRDVKATRSHFDLLLEKFNSDERRSLLSTGTEEDYDEKLQLLTGIKKFMESSAVEQEELSQKEKKSEEENRRKALDVRDAAMKGLIKKQQIH